MAANFQDVIMCFGDSLTERGWRPGGLTEKLALQYYRRIDILNRGYSGYNTDWAIPIFKQCFPKKSDQAQSPTVRILTIWLGANDAAIKPSKQHVPIPKFKDNLSAIIRSVSSPESEYYSPRTRIVLITPPPVNSFQRSAEMSARTPPQKCDREFDVTKQYAQAVLEVAETEQIPAVADVWTSLYNASGHDEKSLSKFLDDGLHLTPEGYQIVFDTVMRAISKHYPQDHSEQIPLTFTPWDAIDVDNLEKSLARHENRAIELELL